MNILMKNGFFITILTLLAACSRYEPSFLGHDIPDDPTFYDPQAALILESADPDILVLTSTASEVAMAELPPPVSIAPSSSREPVGYESDTSVSARARAYLQALYRGDGEAAWRYAVVPFNPQQSWWDSNTAKGALLMKAGSSEYFAAQKQGVQRIDIRQSTGSPIADSIELVAQITYGNGSRSQLPLRMIRQGGEWLVAEE